MYMKPGFYEVPIGKLLPEWCNEITRSNNWEGPLMETLTKPGLGRGGRRVEGLREDDLLALSGVGPFTVGLPAHKALVRFLFRFMNAIGGTGIKRVPAVVGYVNSPLLPIDRCIDRMMTNHVKFPSMNDLGGSAGLTVEALSASLPGLIRRIASLKHLRHEMLTRLRTKLGAIARKLALRQPIDQAERTFYVNYGMEDSTLAFTEEELKGGPLPIFTSAETGDPLVTETWEMLKASVESGPYLRFATLLSNKSFENLVYTFSPQIAALSYHIGYQRMYGPFVEPHVREAITLPWTKDDQLIAARERYLAFNLGDANVVTIHPPVQSSVRGAPGFEPRWDLPQIEFQVDIGANLVAPMDVSFYSAWRKRTLTRSNGANPMTVLMDLALTTERVGESMMDKASLHEFGLLDEEESKKYLNGQDSSKPNYMEHICRPASGTRNIEVVEVDMTDFYTRMGTTMYNPAFREFALAPLHWLHTPDNEAEAYIAARLSLTYEQRIQAERVIRISHNHAKLSRLLSADQLPLPYERMIALCRAISTR